MRRTVKLVAEVEPREVTEHEIARRPRRSRHPGVEHRRGKASLRDQRLRGAFVVIESFCVLPFCSMELFASRRLQP